MPAEKRDGFAEWQQKRIPGSVHFDIDKIADHSSGLPHMMPSESVFAEAVGQKGISNEDQIVCYDSQGIFSAARAWYMFRCYGASSVFVLDGGLPKWEQEGLPIETDAPSAPQPATFHAVYQPHMVMAASTVLDKCVKNQERQVVDARSNGRFVGSVPEPRAGLRSGHIPGARNVPFNTVLAADKTLLPSEQLQSVFEQAGVNLSKPIVTSCGSGVTACVLALALKQMGYDNVALYDGSWSEWGGREDLPVEV
eukprot:GILK01003793.1.p1 GENE.GILK01003793.1~~GILK01003793.1.p1  ORF type:complete len:291 (-),score=37.25 GILK01003793.1:197-955(-)